MKRTLAAAASVVLGAGSDPRGLEAGRARPIPRSTGTGSCSASAGHAGRAARDGASDLRAGDHARRDLGRAVVDRQSARRTSPVRTPRATLDRAAADAAAHDTLVELYPAQRVAIDQQYASELSAFPAVRGAGAGHRRRPGGRGADPAPRTDDGSAATPLPFTARHRARATTSSRRRPSPSRCSPTGRGEAVRAGTGDQFRPPAPPGADERQGRRRASTRSRRSASPTARRGPPTRRRSACSGTRRSGPPGTRSPRPPRWRTTPASPASPHVRRART